MNALEVLNVFNLIYQKHNIKDIYDITKDLYII